MSETKDNRTSPADTTPEWLGSNRDEASSILEAAVKSLGRDAWAVYEEAGWRTHDAAVRAIQDGGAPALVARAFFIPSTGGEPNLFHGETNRTDRNAVKKNRTEVTDDGRFLVDEKWLRESLCVSRATVMRWRDNGTLPPPVLLPGRLLRWRMADIEEWIQSGCKSSRIDGRRRKV